MSRLKSISDKAWHDPARITTAARLASTAPLLVMAVYMYGLRPLALAAVAMLTALLCDLLGCWILRRRWQAADVSSLLFAVLLVCLMPASISYSVVVIAVFTAIFVGKQLFGGFGSYPFHPTALGYMVAVVSWPAQMLTFPAPFSQLGLENTVVFTAAESPAAALRLAGLPNLSGINVLLGNFAGPLGATATLVVLASGLLLLAVGRFDIVTPLAFAGTAAGVLWLFPRVSGVDRTQLLSVELLVCGLAFGAVFLLQDETTAPAGIFTRVLYGALVAVLTVGYQYYSPYPYGVCFGVLWGNALSGFLEHVDSVLRRRLTALWSKLWARVRRKGEQTV